MLKIKEISIFIILLSFMNISDIYSATKSTEVKKEELSSERKTKIETANKLLWNAIEKNNIEQAKDALKNGADVNSLKGIGALTALMRAVIWRHSEMIKLLLENGADINLKLPSSGDSALMIAMRRSSPEIVKLLLENGADVNIKNKENITPLMLSTATEFASNIVREDLLQKAEMLLNYGADMTVKNIFDVSFLDNMIPIRPELQKVVNEYKKRVQKEISETPFFPPGLESLIAEYVGSYPEKKPAEEV